MSCFIAVRGSDCRGECRMDSNVLDFSDSDSDRRDLDSNVSDPDSDLEACGSSTRGLIVSDSDSDFTTYGSKEPIVLDSDSAYTTCGSKESIIFLRVKLITLAAAA